MAIKSENAPESFTENSYECIADGTRPKQHTPDWVLICFSLVALIQPRRDEIRRQLSLVPHW